MPPTETPARVPRVLAKAELAVMRERPDPNTREIGGFRKGTGFEGGEASRQWTKVRLGSLEGWVPTEDIEPLPAPETEMVTVHERPEGDSPVLCEVRKDLQFDSAEPSGDWIKVRLGSLEGWVLATDFGGTPAPAGPPKEARPSGE